MSGVAAAAIDLGSSSGRVVVGTLDGEVLSLEEVHRFPHVARRVGAGLVWDLDGLEEQVQVGVAKSLRERAVPVRSVAVDTWGVDYVLLAPGGARHGAGHAYRDPRTACIADDFYARVGRDERWIRTGVKPDDINTSNQLFADLVEDPALPDKVERVLMLPDYFAYRLCGETGWGRSISSTTGLCEPGGAAWAQDLLVSGEIPDRWFGAVQPDGTLRGSLRSDAYALRSGTEIHVLNAAGHDTACAVHALPKTSEASAAFISSGSWSIVGLETDHPVLSRSAYEAGLTNEARADGGNRLLANITGLWILQECQREWSRHAGASEISELVTLAAASESMGSVLDPGDDAFMLPGDMPLKVAQYCQARYGMVPESRGQMVRVILESLAVRYARAVRQIEKIADQRLDDVYLVGGGSRNGLLCQMTASATGKNVIAGPAEASAIGNLLAQFEVGGTITSAGQRHEIVRRSFTPRTYAPGPLDPWTCMETLIPNTEAHR